ncbi:MAG TPA: alpha/beta hydrolase [Candidatus Saccharimonadales bacterium]|nr:alpha/beta hydrolase [Candidatus Saccharimonadales bacterium]
MNSERVEIKNRRGLKVAIQIDSPAEPKDLVFIAHGQGGFMFQNHIQAFAEVFLAHNFRVVRFDATHSLGDSEGDIFDVTYDNYIEDLEDVIGWARIQSWFQQPFALCGQSMGAQSTAWYAEHHPEQVKNLAPIAPTINYELWSRAMGDDFIKAWQEKGYKAEPSQSKPGLVPKIGWGVSESFKKFDLLPLAGRLTMPVLFMAGEFDQPCPYENQKILFDAIPSQNKKFVKIAGAEHSFRNAKTGDYGQELEEVKKALSDWLDSLS